MLSSSTWKKPASILDHFSSTKGIKQFAWRGIPSDVDGTLTHHLDEKFIEADKRRQERIPSDNLPCNLQNVPKQLYVCSDANMRRTSEVLYKYMREQVYRGEFDSFLNSKEGRAYFLGILPSQKQETVFADLKRRLNESKNTSQDYPSTIRKTSESDAISAQELEALPDDFMHILIKNHNKRDQILQDRKANARRILKEK